MIADLDVPVQVVGVETVREPDGLALSSRNTHLTPAERPLAAALFRALKTAHRQIAGGDTDPGHVREAAIAEIPSGEPSLRLEYLEIVDPETMQPVNAITGPVRVAGALWVGSTRLIDNVFAGGATT
jgi:pantoate--beta-alanine ligase